jgi:hypothetical protein
MAIGRHPYSGGGTLANEQREDMKSYVELIVCTIAKLMCF